MYLLVYLLFVPTLDGSCPYRIWITVSIVILLHAPTNNLAITVTPSKHDRELTKLLMVISSRFHLNDKKYCELIISWKSRKLKELTSFIFRSIINPLAPANIGKVKPINFINRNVEVSSFSIFQYQKSFTHSFNYPVNVYAALLIIVESHTIKDTQEIFVKLYLLSKLRRNFTCNYLFPLLVYMQ